jgi:AcrR family transcriptional regulator
VVARITLTRARIVAAAVELLDGEGLSGLTARALAARLGVQAGAIYHHLPDMRSVADAVATELLREMVTPTEPVPADWRELLEAYGTRVRTVLLRHRDGARVFAGSHVDDATLIEPMEASLAVLADAGFTPTVAVWLLQSVLHLTVGFVIEEQHRQDQAPSYVPDVRAARFDAGRTPRVVAAGTALAADPDAQFAFGLRLLVDGAAGLLDPTVS